MADDIPPQRYTAALANEIEHKWQDRWDDRARLLHAEPHRAAERRSAPHRRSAAACSCSTCSRTRAESACTSATRSATSRTDVYARFQRMNGFNVLHAMGYDAFGLPAEQYAVQTGHAPARHDRGEHRHHEARSCARSGSATIRGAVRPPPTSQYYRWTQWIFLQIYNSWYDDDADRARPIAELVQEFRAGRFPTPGRRPVRRARSRSSSASSSTRTGSRTSPYAPVNWCPGLGTVLANEEVTADGRSERGNFPVYRRPLKQWMLRITAYADRLLDDLDVARLDRLDQADAAQLDRALDRRVGAVPGRGARRRRHRGVHHPARHVVRRHVHGARARASARRRDHRRTSGPTTSSRNDFASNALDAWKGVFGIDRPAARRRQPLPRVRRRRRPISNGRPRAQGEDGRLHRRVRDQPDERRAHPDLHRRLRADGLRHRRDHGGARPRRARLRVRRASSSCRSCRSSARATSGSPNATPTRRRADVARGVRRRRRRAELVERRGLARRPARRRGQARDHRVAGASRVAVAPTVTYKLRDWLFSRQRYWGEPFPIVYDERRPGRVARAMLPVDAARDHRLRAASPPTIPTRCPSRRSRARRRLGRGRARPPRTRVGRLRPRPQAYLRETNTMPQWAGSCWYYLRYLDPTNEDAMVDPQVERAWADGTRRRRLTEGRSRRPLRRRCRARGAAPLVRALLAQGAVRPRLRVDARSRSNGSSTRATSSPPAYIDERGVYVEAAEVEERDGSTSSTATSRSRASSGRWARA